jgi:uncharacterized membrane protein
MRFLQLVLAALLFTSANHAAFVHGDIYTDDLQKLNQTAIKIEGQFTYQLVTEKSNYSIFLPVGEYKLSASNFDSSGKLAFYAEEKIKVGTDDQKVDLILKRADDLTIVIALAIVLIASVFLWSNRHFAPKQNQDRQASEIAVTMEPELDEDAKKVLSVLETMENRASQKDLKEALNFSDAKLSLILTELEHFGYVKKFKRGRGNIIKKL